MTGLSDPDRPQASSATVQCQSTRIAASLSPEILYVKSEEPIHDWTCTRQKLSRCWHTLGSIHQQPHHSRSTTPPGRRAGCLEESPSIGQKQLKEVKEEHGQEEVCCQIKAYCKDGWPERSELTGEPRPYHEVVAEHCIQNWLLMQGSRIVIPGEIRLLMIDKMHQGH